MSSVAPNPNPSVKPASGAEAGAGTGSRSKTNGQPSPKQPTSKPKQRSRRKSDDYNRPVLPYTIHGWREGLKALGVKYRWNTRGKCHECMIENDADWGAWRQATDQIIALIREQRIPDEFARAVRTNNGERTVPYLVSEAQWGRWMDAHAALRENRVDPLRAFIESRPPWDGVQRLGTMPHRLLGAPDTKLNRFVGEQVPTAIVAYALVPEYVELKLDEMPVLQGAGEIAKSSMWKLMVTNVNSDWFTDAIELSDTGKQWGEKLERKCLAEIGEMTGASRADISRMKTRLTAENDGGDRKAHAHHPESQPRKAALYGTCNPWNYLPGDPALMRRFITVECGTAPGFEVVKLREIRKYVKDNLDQLWAEAYHLAKQRGIPYLPDELKAERDTVNARHTFANAVVDDAIEIDLDRIEGLPLAWILKLLDAIGPNETALNCRASKDVRAALFRAGFVNDRRYYGKKQVRVWCRPNWQPPRDFTPSGLDDALSLLGRKPRLPRREQGYGYGAEPQPNPTTPDEDEESVPF